MSGALVHLMVHGYLGTPACFGPYAAAIRQAGDFEVEVICLPGHGQDTVPPFDETAFLEAISTAIDKHIANGNKLALIGHSSGGSLLLTELRRRRLCAPDSLDQILLLVLCATPPKLDLGYAERWAKHRLELGHDREPALHDVAALASVIRRLHRTKALELGVPTLVVQGEEDELVPCSAAEEWSSNQLGGPLRAIRIAGARHNLFHGSGVELVKDVIFRAITDVWLSQMQQKKAAESLVALMPSISRYIDTWPDSLPHLANTPAGRLAMREAVELDAVSQYEPTLANIEITTRCTLGCTACARTKFKLKSRQMSKEVFRQALAALPHAWRIVLVGLGEPLLHPQVLDFIKMATAEGRRVGLVTNAMHLDSSMARALCASGLASLTFSIDALDPEIAEELRMGSDIDLIKANIQGLMAEKNKQGVTLGCSVFTALRPSNIDELPAIIDFSLEAGMDALMLSDLNFAENQSHALYAGLQPTQASAMRREFRRALARGLPVLSVWGLEEFALEQRYRDFLLFDSQRLAGRARRQTHCYSPWQTIPVNVDGQVTICDCQPRAVLGNLLTTPLQSWWNGSVMQKHRRHMLSENPPGECLICPRF